MKKIFFLLVIFILGYGISNINLNEKITFFPKSQIVSIDKAIEYYNYNHTDLAYANFYHYANEENNKIAQYYLGLMYLNGEFVKKDINKAKYWLRKASNNNYEKADYLLAQIESLNL